MFGLAVRRVSIEGGGRRRRTERAFVSHRGPQSSRLGLASAGIEHGNRRIVGVQRQIQLAIAARGTILTTRSLRDTAGERQTVPEAQCRTENYVWHAPVDDYNEGLALI